MNDAEQRVDDTAHPMKPRQANYLLGMVTFAYAMAYVDRQLLNLLVDPIKQSLLISDTDFSFIQGMAFVLAYLAAIPVFGRLVDVTNRRNIMVFGIFAWSFFTAISGFCDNYTELFLARMGVGMTEACVFPAAWSMIGDSFPPKRIPRAMAVFLLGPPLGSGFSLIAGGVVVAFAATLAGTAAFFAGFEPWQIAFIVVGLPGMAFALLLFTMREPPRSKSRADAAAEAEDKPSLGDVATFLKANAALYGLIFFSNGLIALVQLAVPVWFPAFVMRWYELSPTEVGLTLGLISLFTAIGGTLSGAAASEWLSNRGHIDAPFRAAALITLPMIVSCFLIPVFASSSGAFAAAGAVIFFTAFFAGLMSAGTTMASPPRMRGVVASLYSFAAQILGYMIGPFLVASLTDSYFMDPKMVGHSLQIVMTTGAVLLCISMWTILPIFRKRLQEADYLNLEDGRKDA